MLYQFIIKARHQAFHIDQAHVVSQNGIFNVTSNGWFKGEKYSAELNLKNNIYGETLIYNMKLFLDKLILQTNQPSQTEKDPYEEITKYKKLLDDGIISQEEFDRKKNVYLRYYISSFDSIEDIEYDITMSLMVNGYIDLNEYSTINDMNIDKAKELLNIINFDNYSIVVCK